MSWRKIVFDRETLYKEVWKEAVSTVAKRYSVSDVGLRKICDRLGVPVPPLGYWAKVSAGQTPPVPKLPTNHTGPTSHEHQYYVDAEESERDQRVAELLEKQPPPTFSVPTLRESLAECHAVIRRTGKALKPLSYNGRGLLHADDRDVFEMSISAGNKERALKILDAVIQAALSGGGKLEPPEEARGRLMLKFRGQLFRICIRESSERSERALTREEVKQKREGKYVYIADRYTFTPTGKLRLEVREPEYSSTLLSLSDGSTPLETRLENVLPTLVQRAAEIEIRRQMREEERQRWQKAEQRRMALQAKKDKELQRLKKTEEWVSQWKRAADLRAFAVALETADDSEKVKAEVVWIKNAADWLDPTIEKRWPAVDMVEDEESDPSEDESFDASLVEEEEY